jgi:YidC/Oxa1 family membrane protein insertase
LTEYRNPNTDPGQDNKRLLITFLLFAVFIGALQFFLPKPKPQPQSQQQQATPQAQGTPAAAPTASPSSSTSRATAKPAATVPVKKAETQAETVLENDKYRVTLTNQGAVVKSWVLKKFTDNNGHELDLVNPRVAGSLGYPLSMFSYDKDLENKINNGLYVPSATGPQSGAVTFEYSDGELYVRKTFRPEKAYVLGLETEVTLRGQPVAAFPQWPSGLGDQTNIASYSGGKIDWDRSGAIEHKAALSGSFFTGGRKWIVGGDTVPGPFDWAGTADQYFAAVFMPESPKDATLVTLNAPIEVARDASKPDDAKDKANVIGVAVGNANGPTRARIFAGPKTVDVIESTQVRPGGPDLRGLTDWGFFGFIARPLFFWLRWTYQHWIHNWGWAIAFLTLIITMVLLPLRLSSMKSSLKMQKVQPQMKALQEKYKRFGITDPRRAEMQKEISELYKREGVNPVGGCFPMLLQMPFLFAFYSMLANAIELRHASWLWIKDLSSPDPLHILPFIIIALMYLSQKSMPQGGMDPAQQKMLTWMTPIMFGFFSWSTAAGLSVYWMISTFLGYVQQIFINRSALGQQVRKAQERRSTRKR